MSHSPKVQQSLVVAKNRDGGKAENLLGPEEALRDSSSGVN